MNRTTRILRLRTLLLRGQPILDASGWADELDANPRTIQRDLAYLRRHQGLAIHFDPELGGYRCARKQLGVMPELKSKKWARLIGLIHRITAEPGRTNKELAEATGRSSRTLFRDIRELEELGFPLYYDGGYHFLTDAFLPALGLQPRELLALFTGVRMLESVAGDELAADARLAMEKLNRATSEANRTDLGELRSTLQVTAPSEDTGFDRLLELQSVVGNGHQIRLRYLGLQDQKAQDRVVDPMGLFGFRQVWYLRAYDHNRCDYRSYRLSRIVEWEPLETPVIHAAKMNIQDTVYHRWETEGAELVTVEMRVSEPLARWLSENPPHPSQTFQQDRVTYRVSDLVAVSRWIASLHGAEVLAPVEMRQEMARLADELCSCYRAPSRLV